MKSRLAPRGAGLGLVREEVIKEISVQQGWQKSTFCGSGACVEVAEVGGQFLVRDGKNPAGPVLQFTSEEWDAFISGAAAGEFSTSSPRAR